MNDSLKKLSQEQKDSIIEFFVNCIKSGKDFKMEDETSYTLTHDRVQYRIGTSTFDHSKFFRFTVLNFATSKWVHVEAEDVDKSTIDFVENYIKTVTATSGLGTQFTDEEFNAITKLDTNVVVSRAKKIVKIQEKIEEKEVKKSIWSLKRTI